MNTARARTRARYRQTGRRVLRPADAKRFGQKKSLTDGGGALPSQHYSEIRCVFYDMIRSIHTQPRPWDRASALGYVLSMIFSQAILAAQGERERPAFA